MCCSTNGVFKGGARPGRKVSLESRRGEVQIHRIVSPTGALQLEPVENKAMQANSKLMGRLQPALLRAASPLRFAEASDDDAAAVAPEPDASDEDSVVFLGSNAAAPAPAAPPPPPAAPAPAPAAAPVDGPRCGHGKLATEHCPQCAAFLAYEASHGMLVLDQSLAAEGAPPPPSHVIVGKPRTSLAVWKSTRRWRGASET